MRNANRDAIMRIGREEAEARGYNPDDIKSFGFDFQAQKVIFRLNRGHAFSVSVDRLKADDEFMSTAAADVKRRDEGKI